MYRTNFKLILLVIRKQKIKMYDKIIDIPATSCFEHLT